MSSAAKTKRVAVQVRADAHVDEAHLDAGYVSKLKPLLVADKIARELVAAHAYLEVTED
jgi:hypothetical protein